MSARDVLKALVLKMMDQIDETTGEGIHTGLRKACDSKAAHEAWVAIRNMPGDEWANACTWATDPHRNLWLDENVAALEATLSAAGWVVVPVEPTPHMVNRGLERADIDWRAASEDEALSDDEARRIYRAMIAAAIRASAVGVE